MRNSDAYFENLVDNIEHLRVEIPCFGDGITVSAAKSRESCGAAVLMKIPDCNAAGLTGRVG